MSAPRHLQAGKAVQEEALGVCVMEKMQTTSQGKRCEFFLKAKCFFSFFFLNFPCFPGYILKEKLNDQEKVLLAAQQNTCIL